MGRKLVGGGSTFCRERKSSFSETKNSYKAVSQKETGKHRAARNDTSLGPGPSVRLHGGILMGEELRELILKWLGQKFPVLVKCRHGARGEQQIYLIVQWKYLGKKNLQLLEDEYIAQSDALADLLTEWGVVNPVINTIQQFSGLIIPLDVDRSIIDTW